MLGGGHNESFYSPDFFVEAFHARRDVIRNDVAPELGPETDDEVHSACGGPRFTDRGDCRGEALALLRIQKIKLQVSMRGGAKSEDAGLRRKHAGIISGESAIESPDSAGAKNENPARRNQCLWVKPPGRMWHAATSELLGEPAIVFTRITNSKWRSGPD